MKLYDKLIGETAELLASETPAVTPYDPGSCWADNGKSELVMMRDAAFELGGNNLPSVNFTMVTTTEGLIDKDEVCVYGPDLPQIHGPVTFARIVMLEVEDLGETEDEEKAYNAIRDLEFVRYHVYPTGYMVRVSSESNQEQVRLSKQAISNGINFAKVGNDYISKYKALDSVKHAKIIFVVDSPAVEKLQPYAKKVDDITKTLTHILDGMATDCSHCDMKAICDEVEGMKELHLGKKKS